MINKLEVVNPSKRFLDTCQWSCSGASWLLLRHTTLHFNMWNSSTNAWMKITDYSRLNMFFMFNMWLKIKCSLMYSEITQLIYVWYKLITCVCSGLVPESVSCLANDVRYVFFLLQQQQTSSQMNRTIRHPFTFFHFPPMIYSYTSQLAFSVQSTISSSLWVGTYNVDVSRFMLNRCILAPPTPSHSLLMLLLLSLALSLEAIISPSLSPWKLQ